MTGVQTCALPISAGGAKQEEKVAGVDGQVDAGHRGGFAELLDQSFDGDRRHCGAG